MLIVYGYIQFYIVLSLSYIHGLTLISASISIHMHNKWYDEIIYPFPNFNA